MSNKDNAQKVSVALVVCALTFFLVVKYVPDHSTLKGYLLMGGGVIFYWWLKPLIKDDKH